MTVRELIELNQMITDLEITVRKDGTRLLDQLNIGCERGVKPPHPTRVPKSEKYIGSIGQEDYTHRDATYIPKSINSWDDGKDYWHILINRIPRNWLDLEVYSWESHPASTIHTVSSRRGLNVNFHGECVWITALPSGNSLKVKQPKVTETEEYNQMTFEDWGIEVIKI